MCEVTTFHTDRRRRRCPRWVGISEVVFFSKSVKMHLDLVRDLLKSGDGQEASKRQWFIPTGRSLAPYTVHRQYKMGSKRPSTLIRKEQVWFLVSSRELLLALM